MCEADVYLVVCRDCGHTNLKRDGTPLTHREHYLCDEAKRNGKYGVCSFGPHDEDAGTMKGLRCRACLEAYHAKQDQEASNSQGGGQ